MVRFILVTCLLCVSSEALAADPMQVLNATRRKLGLYPLQEDPELTRQAQIRLQDNIRRGRPHHWIINGQWVRPLPAGATEGCGDTFAEDRWFTCEMETRKHRRAGAAMQRMPNGRVWQMLLVR